MIVGLVLRLTAVQSVLGAVSFDYQFFFNLLLPPIILASGYELHQGNFFRNIGAILTFAFFGTFISAVVLGVILYLWTRIPLEGLKITFVEAMAVGATLSATDPVTILAIFNTYKVDPKLYTIIFGESILNDAIAIVLFETAQKYSKSAAKGHLTIVNLFESIGVFLLVFCGSLVTGLIVGIGTSLFLKYTMIRRSPKTESCLIILIAYASYFFSNAISMSGGFTFAMFLLALMAQASCLSSFAASVSNTMPTTTCRVAHNSPRNSSFRSWLNSRRISSSSISVCHSLPSLVSSSSHSLYLSQLVESAWLATVPYSLCH